MIIAVNIRKAIAQGQTVKGATERAWALKLENCEKHKYVIGVENGEIKGYFNLKDVNPDIQFPDRVAFILLPCKPNEKIIIDSHISAQNVSLKFIQRGRYI